MSDINEPLTGSFVSGSASAPPAIHGVVADLNTLFDARHDLSAITVNGEQFAEEVTARGREMMNLSASARQAIQDTLALAAPLRPKGLLQLRSEPDFVAAVLAGHKQSHVFERLDPAVIPNMAGASRMYPDAKPPVPVAVKSFAANSDTLLATATLNATDPTGGVGHGDWTVSLHQDPDAISQVWLDGFGRGKLSHLQLAEIIYSGGGAVVPKASWPADLAQLAARLDLAMAADLADLLAVAAADHRSTTDVRQKADANRGSRQVVMSTANNADVPVPTGLVIAWQPLPGYSAPVLVRLVSLPSDSGPQWQLVPVTLSLAARQLRDLLKANLATALGDAAAVRLVLA
jgi:hypothetical protein